QGLKALALIGISRDGTAGEVDAKAGKLVFNLDPGKKKEKVEPRSIQVTDAVTIIKDNKVVKLADLKMGDPITIEVEQDIVGKELFYAGDEIAAVAADTEEHAHDALRAIKVDYEVLDHIVSEEEVLKNLDKKTTPGGQKGNLQPGTAALKGKPGEDKEEGGLEKALAKAFADAEAVVEGTYGVPVISHQCLESHGLVAEWDKDGMLTVWASTQATVSTAQQLAGRFRVAPTKVKCVTHFMGGGFGSKFGPDVQGMTAADLARRAGAAVKLMLNREEEITTAGNRPSAYGKVKIAGNKD